MYAFAVSVLLAFASVPSSLYSHTRAYIALLSALQEAVKVLTQQYVPLNNTFVYNGIASTGGSYHL